MLHYLLLLAVVPSIGMPVFAGLFTRDQFTEADAARRVGRTMTLVYELEGLRSAVADESAASASRFFSGFYGISLEQLTDILGEDLVIPVDSARERTDRTLARVRPDAETSGAMEAFRAELRDVRAIADASFEPDGATADSAWELFRSFKELARSASAMKRATVDLVATGHYGTVPPAVLTTVEQLQRVIAAVDLANDQNILVQGVYSAQTPERVAQVTTELRDVTTRWRYLSAELPPQVSDEVAAAWVATVDTPEAEQLDAFIAGVAAPGVTSGPDPAASDANIAGRTVVVRDAGLQDVIYQAAGDGVDVAAAAASSADRRAKWALAATVALLAVTGGLLVVIGGLLRRRLIGLAGAAERFSAGRFEAMPVHGPREIAKASAALNDAVAGFGRVAVQAERLSAGELDAPELAEAAPGALGTAVHASVQQIVSAVRDREKLQEALAHQASHDPLTHLPNRSETERLLGQALARATRSEYRVAALFVDLDKFKRCNDTLGHAAGDHVLRTAAERMTVAVRPGDTVCRLGGDEFVVIIEPAGPDRSVIEIAERIAAGLRRPIEYLGHTISIGGSIGVAISGPTSDADSMLREADSAMYLAKGKARGSVEIFDETLRAELAREADFGVAMARALAEDELELYYQPVLDISTGRLKAFEALARWRTPDGGLVLPDQFIPLAEATGFIVDIGRWALRRATAQLVEWSADPAYAEVQVAVNLSVRHLTETSVVDDVRSALEASGLAPDRLMIEITESVAIDSPVAVDHLTQLANLGVLIALDDFGTGYTSIGQLLHLPVHILKIDRSFVSGTNEDGSAVLDGPTRVVDLIIEVAHSLNLGVVAEGVEEPSQLAKLAEVDCENAQGYFFSRPLPAGQVQGWVDAHLLSEPTAPRRS